MELKDLTPEQKEALKAQLHAEDLAKKEQIKTDRETYKKLVDEVINEDYKDLELLSQMLVEKKAKIFSSVEGILEMKAKIFGVKEDQQSHTFTTSDGKTIKLGHRIIDQYDDTKSAGVSKVHAFLKTLSKDENSAMLVETVMGLLKSDEKGNLKPSRVMELEKLAEKSRDANFIDGIRIIKESHSAVKTCQFITASYKDKNGIERALPLSMSSAE